MADDPSLPVLSAPSPAFFRYVLSHAHIRTNVCSCQAGDHGYTLLQRTVPDYNFIFVDHGTVYWVLDGVEHALNPGDLIVIPPHVPHSAHSAAAPFRLGSIHVDVTLPGGVDAFDLLVLQTVRRVKKNTILGRYLCGTFDEWNRKDDYVTLQMMPAWARLVTLELFRHDLAAGTLRQRNVDPLVMSVLDHLADCIDAPVTLQQLAGYSGYSGQHLNKLFRRALGTTPLQYLTRMRMQRAAAMLHDGRLTVRAVARQVGFADPFHFSRQFKQFTGQSPADYRAMLAANDAPDSESPSAGSQIPFTP